MTRKRRNLDFLDAHQLRREHESGESILAIAGKYGVARGAVSSRILSVGGVLRSASDAIDSPFEVD